jgi:hypothetical protein
LYDEKPMKIKKMALSKALFPNFVAIDYKVGF